RPVRLPCGSDQESVDRSPDLEFLHTLCGIEFRGSQFERFVLLAVRAGEYDYLAPICGRELDGHVAKPPYTDDADSLGRADIVRFESVEDGGTAAHQGSCVLGLEVVRDLEEESLTVDRMGSQGAQVEVAGAIHLAQGNGAKSFLTCEAWFAVAAGGVKVAEPNTLASISRKRYELLMI
ncbi:MAG: hypothetical protein Q9214_002560, partial [Letrouitia sp. 1 TL-2023]